ncbi:MAG: hypothetical protein V1685_03050 [Parcubacteria group bacterium]
MTFTVFQPNGREEFYAAAVAYVAQHGGCVSNARVSASHVTLFTATFPLHEVPEKSTADAEFLIGGWNLFEAMMRVA